MSSVPEAQRASAAGDNRASQRTATSSPPTLPEVSAVLAAGDVLCVRGTGQLADIGTTGGFMGHVLVALGPLRRLSPESAIARELRDSFPAGSFDRGVWRVETVESTRSHAGLHRCELLLHEPRSGGRLVVVGELAIEGDGGLTVIDEETVELYQSPPELRSQLQARPQDVADVVSKMKAAEKSWSLATAARALLKSAPLTAGGNRAHALQEIKECWHEAPICTSVVVVFWQRCLCRLARGTPHSELDSILKYMPLKSDRGLPGELISTMRRCGWTQVHRLS